MHIVKPAETSAQEIEDISKKMVDQTTALLVSYQEMQQAFMKARFAFYCACLAPGLYVAKSMLAPFVPKEE